MADAVTTQRIVDNGRRLVVKYTNVSDATGETAVVKLNAATEGCTSFSIERIDFATAGMGVDILFDATTDALAISLPQDVTDQLDFTAFGGIPDPLATGTTGNILFTTVGAALADRYTVILYVRKNG